METDKASGLPDDALIDEAMKAFFVEGNAVAMNRILWDQMKDIEPAVLLAIPERIALFEAGNKEFALVSPLVYFAAAVTSIWQEGYYAGKEAGYKEGNWDGERGEDRFEAPSAPNTVADSVKESTVAAPANTPEAVELAQAIFDIDNYSDEFD